MDTKIDLTNEDLYNIRYALNVGKKLPDAINRFVLIACHNVNLLDTKIKQLEELRAKSEQMEKYDKERFELMQKYCITSPDGNVIFFKSETSDEIIDDNATIGFSKPKPEFKEQWNTETEALKVTYKKEIAKHDKKLEAFSVTLKEIVEPKLPLYRIPSDILPVYPQHRDQYLTILLPLIDL